MAFHGQNTFVIRCQRKKKGEKNIFKICDLYLNIRLQCSTFLLVDGFNINIQMLQVCFFL